MIKPVSIIHQLFIAALNFVFKRKVQTCIQVHWSSSTDVQKVKWSQILSYGGSLLFLETIEHTFAKKNWNREFNSTLR